jgi:hypothetical protein
MRGGDFLFDCGEDTSIGYEPGRTAAISAAISGDSRDRPSGTIEPW